MTYPDITLEMSRAKAIEDERRRIISRLKDLTFDEWSDCLGALEVLSGEAAGESTPAHRDTLHRALYGEN